MLTVNPEMRAIEPPAPTEPPAPAEPNVPVEPLAPSQPPAPTDLAEATEPLVPAEFVVPVDMFFKFGSILPPGYVVLPPPPAEQLVARSQESIGLEGAEMLCHFDNGLGWFHGQIKIACRARSKKEIDGEPVNFITKYDDDPSYEHVCRA